LATIEQLQPATKFEKPVTNASDKVYFLSDAHLRPDQDKSLSEQRLVEVLRKAKADASHVYIVR